MKNLGFDGSKSWSNRRSIFGKATINLKQVAIAFVFTTFMLPINNRALADKEIKPGKKQATLILSDGSKILLGVKSDTIVNSQNKDVRIIVDSTGINYVTVDSILINDFSSDTSKNTEQSQQFNLIKKKKEFQK